MTVMLATVMDGVGGGCVKWVGWVEAALGALSPQGIVSMDGVLVGMLSCSSGYRRSE